MMQPALIRTLQNVKLLRPGKLLQIVYRDTHTSLSNYSIRNSYKDYLKVSPRNAEKLKIYDGVPKVYDLIYNCPVEGYLKYAYPVFLFFVTVAPLAVLIVYYIYGNPLVKGPAPGAFKVDIKFISPEVEIWIYLGTMIFCAGACLSILSKVPVRIYKHNLGHDYIAMYNSLVPTRYKKHKFYKATQTRFINPILYFFRDSHYFLDGKKGIIFQNYFRTPGDLFDMLDED